MTVGWEADERRWKEARRKAPRRWLRGRPAVAFVWVRSWFERLLGSVRDG